MSHLKILLKLEIELFCRTEMFLSILEMLLRDLFLATVHRDLRAIIGLFLDIIGLEEITECVWNRRAGMCGMFNSHLYRLMSSTCSRASCTRRNSMQCVLTCLLNSQCMKVPKLTTHLLGVWPKIELILLLGGDVARQLFKYRQILSLLLWFIWIISAK